MHKTKRDRYDRSLNFLQKHVPEKAYILDLGTPNPLSAEMKAKGYHVENTSGVNLDIEYEEYANKIVDAVTAFEIFEHMLAPFNILRQIKAPRLIASIPLKLWFAQAYWNEEDDWDKHYHEFEVKQFDFLLEKSGWVIKDKEIWKSYSPYKLGIRPFLRRLYPRYYLVYCEKNRIA